MSGTHTGDDYDVGAVTGSDPTGGGVAHGRLLTEFAEAVCAREETWIAKARSRIIAAMDDKALRDIAAVVAGFSGYPRIADATGIPLEDYKEAATADMRATFDLNRLDKRPRIGPIS
jgi:hypothetical protein